MRKQGQSDREVREGWKRDPIPHAMNVKGVSEIGASQGNHITGRRQTLDNVPEPLHAGRGFVSPLGTAGSPGVGIGRNLYPKGSQGGR